MKRFIWTLLLVSAVTAYGAAEFPQDTMAMFVCTQSACQTQTNHNPELYEAIIHNDISRVKCLLAAAYAGRRDCTGKLPHHVPGNNFDVYALPDHPMIQRDNDGRMPLHIAARAGHNEIVRCLLPYDPSFKGLGLCELLSYQDYEGKTALHYAVDNEDKTMVSRLLLYQVNCNICDINLQSSLHVAATKKSKSSLDIVKLLLIKGAFLDAADCDNQTPLHYAARSGNLPMVKLLVAAGARVFAIDVNDQTPQDLAVANKHDDVADFLQNLNQERLALHDAIKHCDIGQIKQLASCNSLVQALDDGLTPLDVAAQQGNIEAVKIILDNNGQGKPLHYAAAGDHLALVKWLLANGWLVSDLDESGQTPLHAASCKGNLEAVQLLVSKGACVNSQSEHGITPLHCAIMNGKTDVVKFLLKAGAHKNCQSCNGYTPLHWAVHYNQGPIAIMLINKGACTTIQDDCEYTPVELATKLGNDQLAEQINQCIKDNKLARKGMCTLLCALNERTGVRSPARTLTANKVPKKIFNLVLKADHSS